MIAWRLFLAVAADGCVAWTASAADPKPDKVLFERAEWALTQNKADVASVTLQTLINTYPTSSYADRARKLRLDPRILKTCGETVWHMNGPNCDDEQMAALAALVAQRIRTR